MEVGRCRARLLDNPGQEFDRDERVSTRGTLLITPTSVTPQFEIYCDRTLLWVHLGGDEMRRFPKMRE